MLEQCPEYNVCLEEYSVNMWVVAHISRWVRHCSACCDAHCVVSQSLIGTLLTVICKLSLENDFLDLNVNGNVLLNIGLKELICHIIVSTKLKWAVFGCCGCIL